MNKTKMSIIAVLTMAATSMSAYAETLSSDAGKTSDLFRNNIQTQLDREVDLRDRDAGLNAYFDQGLASGGNIFSAGVQGAYKVQDKVSVGGGLQMPINSRLSGDYQAKGSSNPNFSLYTKYQENENGTGLNAKLSGAYGYQKMGVNPFGDYRSTSKMNAYGVQAQTGYGLTYSNILVTPYTGISYTNTRQGGFDNNDVNFSKFSEERTSMQFGVKAKYDVNSMLHFDADTGIHANLKTKRHGLNATYNGDVYRMQNDDNKLQPYVGLGMTADIDRDSSVRVSGNVNRQSYDNTTGDVSVSYQYRF